MWTGYNAGSWDKGSMKLESRLGVGLETKTEGDRVPGLLLGSCRGSFIEIRNGWGAVVRKGRVTLRFNDNVLSVGKHFHSSTETSMSSHL